MIWPKNLIIGFYVAVAVGVTIILAQHQGQARLEDEKQSLEQHRLAAENDSKGLSNRLARMASPPPAQANYLSEMARLRTEVEALRRQTNELQQATIKATRNPPPIPADDQDQVLATLPEDYPQTPQAATQAVLGFFSRGDADGFFKYFGQPGGRKMYDQIFADAQVRNLLGMQIIAVGEPTTNGIASDILMVPYQVRLRDGTERARELRLVQDPETQRWYFKGGL